MSLRVTIKQQEKYQSVIDSISNFFRRMSPGMHYKSKKGNISNSSSQNLSSGDDMAGSFHRQGSSSSLSKRQLRRSLLKLMDTSKKEISSHDDVGHTCSSNDAGSKPMQKSAANIKSIDKHVEMYYKYNDKQVQNQSQVSNCMAHKSQPLKTSSYVLSPNNLHIESVTPINSLSLNRELNDSYTFEPSDSLDRLHVPKPIYSHQVLYSSGISAGDSFIDTNLNGNEPSLLSNGPVESKHVAVTLELKKYNSSQSSVPQTTLDKLIQAVPFSNTASEFIENKCYKDVKISYSQMPIILDSAEYLPKDITHRTPSYLRISSTVSGYGQYSQYNAFKGIETRSPYSSTLLLCSSHSDLTTPLSLMEMPIGKIPKIQPPTNFPPLKTEILSSRGLNVKDTISFPLTNCANCACENGVYLKKSNVRCDRFDRINGGNEEVENGCIANFISTGDYTKDADYFLGVAALEENRLLMLCSKCQLELNGEDITEEGLGKIRSAVGKANLLINQKFRQFQNLCQQHKNPEADCKPTKWEDLQGFWEMVKLQINDVQEMFTDIDLLKQNGWREINIHSYQSSDSSRSSKKSNNLDVSNASTLSNMPGSQQREKRLKDTPESSPERSQKAKVAAKVRDEARKQMLAEKRAAMKQKQTEISAEAVEMYVADNSSKLDSCSGSDV